MTQELIESLTLKNQLLETILKSQEELIISMAKMAENFAQEKQTNHAELEKVNQQISKLQQQQDQDVEVEVSEQDAEQVGIESKSTSAETDDDNDWDELDTTDPVTSKTEIDEEGWYEDEDDDEIDDDWDDF